MPLRIGNKTLAKKNTRTVTFYRGEDKIELTVGPMPPKYLERIREHVLTAPQPPRKAVESRPGSYLKVDGELVFSTDENDPTYTAAFTRYISLIVTAKLAAYLAHDPSVEFEAVRPTKIFSDAPAEWKAYLEALLLEINDESTGFTQAEVNHILEQGDKTELCLTVTEATKTFL